MNRGGITWTLAAILTTHALVAWRAEADDAPTYHDLSLLIATEYPCTWPQGWPHFQMNPYRRIGPRSAFNSEILTIDPNTGTQIDTPPHSIPLPDSGLPNAGPAGTIFSEQVPAWQFCGEACVIDCTDLVASAEPGRSPLISKDRVMAWERKHRPLRFGDVVIFRSGYADRFYRPFPEGRRFLIDPLEKKTPAWPDPDPECMEYLGRRKVMHVAIDSPSMGPIPDLQEPVHIAGLKFGMIFTEGVTNVGALPATGAFYCSMGPRHAGCAGTEARAISVVDSTVARRLIASARARNVVDLSPVLMADLPLSWPGASAGEHRQPYVKGTFGYNPNVASAFNTHILDSHCGTHLVPPAYALPAPGFDNAQYAPEVRRWLADYERAFGPRGTSDVTVDKVPVSHTCGPARVVDVRHLAGTTAERSWPASPEITPAHIDAYEQKHGPLKPGEIVVFRTGHTDRHLKPLPEGSTLMADPLVGNSEGWPAPGPATVQHLAERGIRCLAIDAPTLGGVEPRRALMTYWALGSAGMVGVEFLFNVDQVPENAFFLFCAPKIRNAHGAPGRAIALH